MPDNLEHLPLPPPEHEPHRVVTGYQETQLPERDPAAHAEQLSLQVSSLEKELSRLSVEPRPEDSRGFLYSATFAKDSDLGVKSLSDKKTGNAVVDFDEDTRRALVYTPRPKLSALRKKINRYGDPQDLTEKGEPRHQLLVAPLETLAPATLFDLSDGWIREDAMPESEWVELWVWGGQRGEAEERERRRDALAEFLKDHGLLPGATLTGELQSFAATEHDIYLVKLTKQALLDLPGQLPEAFHLSPPQRAVVPQMLELQKGELGVPEVEEPPEDGTTVAILDTGVAEAHPLLKDLLLGPGSSSIVGDPKVDDTSGHGTKMAGLAAYRDLGLALSAGGTVAARCRLQNVRILSGTESPDPDPMLERTRDGVLEAEQISAARRIFSLSLGAPTSQPEGSTPWSVAVDRLAATGGGRLFCVAAGNTPIHGLPKPGDYPASNRIAGLTSPGEAYNALTVGAITDLTDMDGGGSGRSPVAAAGQLNPSSRCDVGRRRPVKPDVVIEGGNLSADSVACRQDQVMQLLTTCKEHAYGPWLTTASMTSAATAKIAGLAAEIWQANPNRLPETIRGLLVHSARWTPAMKDQFSEVRERLRAVGFGTPSADPAKWSEYARPTVIFEGQIHPLRKLELGDGSKRGREMHFHNLPLPQEELEALMDSELELTVTLSYFAQPNETRSVRYLASGLRWEIQRPLESQVDFRKRINRLEREDGEKFSSEAEPIGWDIGPRSRMRGTVQSDRARLSAAQLRDCRAVAVWPVGGWWDDREIKGDPALRYSLIITIDAGEQEVDLYTPILNEISIRTEV
jgi:Subtilase family